MAELQFTIKEFDPTKKPWHEKIIQWPYEGLQPRDCSWGFVWGENEKIHIHAGDFLIDVFGEFYLVKKENFKEFKKRWNKEFSKIFKL